MKNNEPNLICNKCGLEVYSVIPQYIQELPGMCQCGGTLKVSSKYNDKNLPIKKIIEINPDNVIKKGSCFTNCLMKLFSYYKKDRYEIIYKKQYIIKINNIGLDENDLYDISKSMDISTPNYFQLMESLFNVSALKFNNITFCLISKYIKQDIPILISLSGNMINWTNITNHEQHVFLLVGYDIEKEIYVCIDPIFSKKYVMLPFKILEDNNSTAAIINFNKFQINFEVDNFMIDLDDVYNVLEKCPISNQFLKISKAINHNKPYITFYNYGIYAISNFINIKLCNRFACLSTFYGHLYQKYNYIWLMEISGKYNDIYNQGILYNNISDKFRITKNEEKLHKYINIINKYFEVEKEVEKILLENKV